MTEALPSPKQTATVADGTHPTGMQSLLIIEDRLGKEA